MIKLVLFYFFSGLSLVSASIVISVKNPVFSVVFLILVFFNVVGLLLLLGAEFLSLLFLIVYVGAIAVLFLFVVMILNLKFIELRSSFFYYAFFGSLIMAIFLFEIFIILNSDLTFASSYFLERKRIWVQELYSYTNLQILGNVLYTSYSYLFILSGFVLLVAILGAIILTLYQRSQIRRQDPNVQVVRNFDDTIRFFKFLK
uniref:NADH-ubiquinone oxidoreductase chain 6 n=1 Tax=Cyanidium caldarium TaxID=2771 RepID=NU6M_CYACA|nr:RecName: Full=NADH-ubiquinone oxidoreductase chain 6; AltName: Full=NADH dehydrogenase subunit 6 [Cyanidium caldarium]CAA88767.1 NADH dehydrogenase subunit 6 [Cyanidium caldarium]